VNVNKGYGFIYTPGYDDNIFFHTSNVEKDKFTDLAEGMDVSFSIEKSNRGFVAVDVAVKV